MGGVGGGGGGTIVTDHRRVYSCVHDYYGAKLVMWKMLIVGCSLNQYHMMP